MNEGKPLEGITRLESALETLRAAGDDNADVAEVAEKLARVLVLAGRRDEAHPHFELALGLAEALDLPEVFVNALTTKGLVVVQQDRLAEARILLEGAVARAVAEDLPRAAARALNNLGVILESADRYAETLDVVTAAIEQARRAGDRVWELILRTGCLSTLVLLGRWHEALDSAAELEGIEGIELARGQLQSVLEIDCWRGNVEQARRRLESDADLGESEEAQARSGYRLHEAMVLRREGKVRAALEALQTVIAARDTLGIRFLHVKLAIVEAIECALDLGDAEKVHELLDLVDALRPGERPPLLAAHASRFRARLTGTPREAEAEYAGAIDLFRELNTPFWLAATQLEQAEWLLEHDRADEAQPLLEEARQTFERLEARPCLERAVEALTRREPAVVV